MNTADGETSPEDLRNLVVNLVRSSATDEEVRRIHQMLLEWEEQRKEAEEKGKRLTPFDEDAIEDSIRHFRDEHPRT